MFDRVAEHYDITNDVLSLGQVRLWRRAAVEAVNPAEGQTILDIAAGTGTSTEALASHGAEVVGCDLSPGMLEVARRKHPELLFVEANATRLPFARGSFDAVTISFGIRNVEDVEGALREMLRVTKPGGKLVIVEFSTPTSRWFRRLYFWYLKRILPRVASITSTHDSAYGYLTESITDWPDQSTFGRKIRQAGWKRVAHRNLTGGLVAIHRAIKPETKPENRFS